MAKKNTEILEQVKATSSAEMRERLSNVDLRNGQEVYGVLKDYPTVKNEFINTLTNKIVGSKTYSKIYENQLKMLHKGKLSYGQSLEQLFVQMAEAKGFLDHFDADAATDEADLIRKIEADVRAMYIQRNFRLKYKTSVSEQQLQAAFANQEGLSNLIGQLTSRNASSAEFKEFDMMKNILKSSASLQALKETATGELELSGVAIPVECAKQPMKQVVVGDFNSEDKKAWANNFLETVRALAGKMKFPSTEYNMAGVRNWTDPSELVLITTADVNARLDVQSLAAAFNVSSADLQVRVILVDELPTTFASTAGVVGTDEKECYGILMDSAHIQAYDTLVDSGNFYNPASLTTNMFLHRQGIMAQCLYSPIVALVKE